MISQSLYLAALVLASPTPLEDFPNKTTEPPKVVEAVSDNYIFYNPDGIGAHAFYTPWSIIIASGFEEYASRPLNKLNLIEGQKNVLTAIKSPFDTISEYGTENFIYQQLLPGFWQVQGTPSYLPNYLWHLIGGGFRFRMMSEYYRHHKFEYPELWSFVTLYAGHWINEAVQAQEFSGGSADALADLFFFDWIGKLLFMSTPVSEFFRDFFHLRDWTFQTSWDPLSNSLLNTGQLYWSRISLWGGWSISSLTGHTINALNATYSPNDDSMQWTLGMGLQANRFTVLENNDLSPSQFQRSLLLAYSENDNPIAILIAKEALSGNTMYEETATGESIVRRDNYSLAPSIQLNIYPKWLEIWGQKMAAHLTWERGALFLGIGHGMLPLGISLSTPLDDKYRDDY